MAAELQFVGFRVGPQSYALPIATVREIVRPPEITPVPQSPAHVAGVMNLRGRIVPVVDLRKRFCQKSETSPKCRVLVIALDGPERSGLIGLLVDAASEVLKIAPNEVEPSPKLFGEDNERYVTGVARHQDRLVVLLDAHRLLPERERAAVTA